MGVTSPRMLLPSGFGGGLDPTFSESVQHERDGQKAFDVNPVSIVIAAGKDDNRLFFNGINKPVCVIDAARPIAG